MCRDLLYVLFNHTNVGFAADADPAEPHLAEPVGPIALHGAVAPALGLFDFGKDDVPTRQNDDPVGNAGPAGADPFQALPLVPLDHEAQFALDVLL